MIQSKKIHVIVAIAVVFALASSVLLIVLGNTQSLPNGNMSEPTYVEEIFGADVISIEILADEADWQEMLDSASSEQFIMADVIVNGTKFQSVGIRPKGNSSLIQVANSDSDRYSFRLQFDEYVKGQTCFGLQSFVINNMLGDNTYMKEYVSYELMKEIGVDSPYFGFADVQLNGEAWGFYLAVELYNDSYEERVHGTTAGMLYNVKAMDMGGGNDLEGGFARPEGNMQIPDGVIERPEGNIEPADEMGAGGFGMGGRTGGGGSLEYTDDDPSSYSSIFNNAVGKSNETDSQRVIAALKALSEGEELETYFDVDQILRYLAAHTIVVNLDSYSSSMAQNYYIYENDGKITVLPWDYNLAWGGFQSGGASSVINFPIDTPVNGVEMSSRPLIEKLFENETYLERYHGYLQTLMDEYFADGKWETKISELNALIDSYVENDKTAFCTFEEYKTAVEAFKAVGNLRYQSIQGQLDGTVPSTTAEQTSNPDKLISADTLNLSSLGSMMVGGNRGDMGDQPTNPQGGENFDPGQTENMPDRELMTQAMQILQDAGGIVTDEVKTKLLELSLTENQITMLSQIGNGFQQIPGGNMQEPTGNNTRVIPNQSDTALPVEGQMARSENTTQSLLIYSGLFALVLISTFFVAKKKRNY